MAAPAADVTPPPLGVKSPLTLQQAQGQGTWEASANEHEIAAPSEAGSGLCRGESGEQWAPASVQGGV